MEVVDTGQGRDTDYQQPNKARARLEAHEGFFLNKTMEWNNEPTQENEEKKKVELIKN